MAKDRLSLHNQLITLLGSPNVYFQPPPSIAMKYPCIIYNLDDIEAFHANNKMYIGMKRYLVTAVDRNPDSLIYESILSMPYSALEDVLVKDNLNQHVCSLYW